MSDHAATVLAVALFVNGLVCAAVALTLAVMSTAPVAAFVLIGCMAVSWTAAGLVEATTEP